MTVDPRLTRLLRRVGRRGASLIFLALVDEVFAYGLLTLPPATWTTPGYRFLVELLPLAVWAGVWGAVGLTCLVYAFARKDRAAFAAASMLKVLWGMVYLLGWAAGAIPRGYVSAVLFLGFAGFIQIIAGWRENWER